MLFWVRDTFENVQKSGMLNLICRLRGCELEDIESPEEVSLMVNRQLGTMGL